MIVVRISLYRLLYVCHGFLHGLLYRLDTVGNVLRNLPHVSRLTFYLGTESIGSVLNVLLQFMQASHLALLVNIGFHTRHKALGTTNQGADGTRHRR